MTKLTIPRYAPIWPTILRFNTHLVKVLQSEPKPAKVLLSEPKQYVEIPHKDDIEFSTQDFDFTVAFWVFVSKKQHDMNGNENAIVVKWLGTGRYSYGISYLNTQADTPSKNTKADTPSKNTKADTPYEGKIIARSFDGTKELSVISKKPINDGLYHYIAFVRKKKKDEDKVELQLYVDGELSAATNEDNLGDTTNESPLYLGRRGDGKNYFSGSIGRLLIFNKGLDQKEIKMYMKQSTSLLPWDSPSMLSKENGLVGDWRCNEGYGAIAFDYAKGNNGLLRGDNDREVQPEWITSGISTQLELFTDSSRKHSKRAANSGGSDIPPQLKASSFSVVI